MERLNSNIKVLFYNLKKLIFNILIFGYKMQMLNLNIHMLGYKIQRFNINMQRLNLNTIITKFGLKLNVKKFVYNAFLLRMSSIANNHFD